MNDHKLSTRMVDAINTMQGYILDCLADNILVDDNVVAAAKLSNKWLDTLKDEDIDDDESIDTLLDDMAEKLQIYQNSIEEIALDIKRSRRVLLDELAAMRQRADEKSRERLIEKRIARAKLVPGSRFDGDDAITDWYTDTITENFDRARRTIGNDPDRMMA